MSFPKFPSILVALFAALTLNAQAQAQAPITDAKVVASRVETGRLTLEHGPVPHVGVPAMKVSYAVRSPSILSRLQMLDDVRVRIEKIDGKLYVTCVEGLLEVPLPAPSNTIVHVWSKNARCE